MVRTKEAAPAGGLGRVQKALGFFALIVATFMGVLDSTIVNIALPDITTYFHADLNDSAWITTVYILALAVFMITASKLADQFGRKRLMIVGLVLFGISSAVCGFAQTLGFLIAVRLLQGLGAAIVTPVVIPMVLELYGREKMAAMAGVIGAVTGLAAAGGPPLGGVLIEYFGWRSIFFVNVPFAVLALVLLLFCTRESFDASASKRVDFAGVLLLSAALFLLSFALLKGNDYGWGSAPIVAMLAGAAAAFVLFVLTERFSRAPMIEFSLFREKTLTASSLCYLFTGFGLMSSALIFNYFLQNVRGFHALDAAFVVMFASITTVVSMPLGSLIASRFTARPVNFLGLLLTGAGSLLLARVGVDTGRAEMVGIMVVTGFGLGFSCQSIISSIKHLPSEKSGIGSGIVNAARQIGTCLGIALLVSLLDANIAAAKTDIQTDALRTVDRLSVADPVKAVAKADLQDFFSSGGTTDTAALQKRMQTDIQAAMLKTAAQSSAAGSTAAGLGSAAASSGSVAADSAAAQQAAQAAVQARLLAQQKELETAVKQIERDKDDKLTRAFQNVFFIAGVILAISSVFGLQSDRRNTQKAD